MTNFRTTLIGAGLAVLMAIKPIMDAWKGDPADWRTLGMAVGLAVFGYLAKDSGVTGTEK